MSDALSSSLQDNILTLACFSDASCGFVRNAVPTSLFTSKTYRLILTHAYDYIDRFGNAPKDHIADELEEHLNQDSDESKLMMEVLEAAKALSTDINEEYVLGQLSKFVRQQSLKVGIVKAHELVQQGDLDAAELELTKAVKARMDVFSPGVTLEQVGKRLAAGEDFREPLATGIEVFDRMGLGPARKELHLFIGPPKRGKCTSGDTLVLLPDGSRKRMDHVVRDKDKKAVALDEATQSLVVVDIAQHWSNGRKQCVELRTKLGKAIVTTENHLYLTIFYGWTPVEELRVGVDRIAITWSDGFVRYDLVVAITKVGVHETYDLGIPDHHNFIANDIVVHNSWWLVHLTKRAMMQRWRGVYVTLELADQFVGKRQLQSQFALTSRPDVEDTFTRFQRGDNGGLEDLETKKLRRPSITDDAILQSLTTRIDDLHINERLLIKEFPTGALTVAGLETYLDSLERSLNFIPDYVVLDYADLMQIDAATYRHSLGTLYKNLRGLAVERNLALITASQSNREGAGSKLVSDTHVAEDYSKIAIADCVITYNQTAAERARRLARLYVASGRVEADRFAVLVSQSYASGQFALDSLFMKEEYWSFVNSTEGEGDDSDSS